MRGIARRPQAMAQGGLFKVSEVVQMAIDEEHNGVIFYETLQKCAKSRTLKEASPRLAAEAQRQLGQEGRWRELYELNRRIFPEPNRIRVGARVKLPSDGNRGSEDREASG
jgi:hypothetical protein